MRRFLLPLLFSLLAINTPIMAQSNVRLEGYVYAETGGAPVAGATVELLGTAYRNPTDSRGYFAFKNLPENSYAIKISAIGYRPEIINDVAVESTSTRKLEIYLKSRLHLLEGITVTDDRLTSSGIQTTVLEKEQIVESGARDLSELLDQVEGIYVRKTGTTAGKSEVSIRGSSSQHVLVLLDGQKLNPSGTGIADLNSIPLDIVERIEIQKGGASAVYGPDALAGVINIITQPGNLLKDVNLEGEAVTGSWQTHIYNFTLSNPDPVDNLNLNFAYNHKRSVGDFEYDYEVGGVGNDPVNIISDTRRNNYVNTENLFSSGLYRFSPKFKISYSAQFYENSNGLPGRPGNQNLYAHVDDSRRFVTTTFTYLGSSKYNLELDLGFSRFKQHFKDQESGGIPYDSRYLNDIATVRTRQDVIPWRDNSLKTGFEIRRDILYHDDFYVPAWSMKRTRRDNWGLYVTDNQQFDVSFTEFFEKLVLNGSLRYDNSYTSKDSTSWQDTTASHFTANWSPRIGLALSRENEWLSYIARVRYGRSFRLPDINALFWKGDVRSRGNPGLRPEKSEDSEVGIESALKQGQFTLRGGITYFRSRITDLIVWVQAFGGIWQPQNIASANIDGHEEFITVGLYDNLLEFKYQNTVTDAVNKSPEPNVFDKQLVFSPHYITDLSAILNIHDFSARYIVRLVDKAYILPANTKFYESYRLDDVHLKYENKLYGPLHLSLQFDIFNLRDKDYVLITHSPMPGREWNFGISFSYGDSKK